MVMQLKSVWHFVRRHIVSFLMAIIAVASLCIALQSYFARPGIAITELASVNVLDINRDTEGLSVLFRGEDLQESGKTLRAIRLRIENTGDMDITPSMFDQQIDWGLGLSTGEVIEVRITSASSSYLEEQFTTRTVQDGKMIVFPRIVFDREEWIELECVVVQGANDLLHFQAFGKVSGIRSLAVVPQRMESTASTVTWTQRAQAASVSALIALFLIWLWSFTVRTRSMITELQEIRATIRRTEGGLRDPRSTSSPRED